MCQNFNISALLLKTSNHLTNQQDDSKLDKNILCPAALTNILLHLFKDINKLKGLLLNAGNSFIADAIRRFFSFFVSYHSPSANFAMQISPLRGAKDPSTGGWVAISPRMLSIRLSSLVPAQISTAKGEHLHAINHTSQESLKTSSLWSWIWLHVGERHPDGMITWFIP